MDKPTLYLQTEGPVARLVMNRPMLKNAFDREMWSQVPDLVAEAAAAPEVRVLVLTSSTPGIFSAGADLVEFERFQEDLDGRRDNHAAIGAAARAIAGCPKPVIAAINGVCMGGGFVLAGAADMRIASDVSRFGFPPAKLGLLYHYQALIHLVGLIGPGQTKRLMFTAEVLTAEKAAAIGLIEQQVPAHNFAAVIDQACQSIAALSSDAIAAMKRQINAVAGGEVSEGAERAAEFLAAHDGPDHKEGLRAFREKRTPQF